MIKVKLKKMNFPAISRMDWKRGDYKSTNGEWGWRKRSRYDSTKVLAEHFTTLCHVHFLFKGLYNFPKDNTAVRHVILEPLFFQFIFPNMLSGLRVAESEKQSFNVLSF